MDFVVTRNSTGQIIHSEGNIVSMFDWLSSAYLNTTYKKISVRTKIALVSIFYIIGLTFSLLIQELLYLMETEVLSA